MRQILSLALVALLAAPTAALAHTGLGAAHGLAHGFMHPIGGLDHILAMVTVGLFAYQLGGRALWLVTATFVLVMAGGGALGFAGWPIPYVEVGIALSLVVLGAIVALGIEAPVAVAMALVGVFAIFHGHAHGAEMPQDAGGAAYALGFMGATALLHGIGIGLGALTGLVVTSQRKAAYRVAGSAVALAGIGLLTQIA